MSEAESASRITEVGTVGVPVRDQNEALDFYVRNLGFEKAPGCPDGDARCGDDEVFSMVEAGNSRGIRRAGCGQPI